MFPEERYKKISELLEEQDSVRVTELSRLLQTSEVTVRRDLEEMERQNKLVRIHGGAVSTYLVGKADSAPELISNETCLKEKQCICQFTYEHHVHDDDTILTDSSSTVYELIKLIAAGSRKNLTIVTTSPLVVRALAGKSDCKVIMLGGEFNYTHNVVEGLMVTRQIQDMRADRCFLGVNGIDEVFGYSTPREIDAEIKMQMIRSSRHSYFLADNTKFGKTYFSKVNAKVDFIITDEKKPNKSYSWLEGQTHLLFAK